MKQVLRYECPFCKKLFKQDKHFCFKDPANRACASCKGWHGYEQTGRDEEGEPIVEAVCSITGFVIREQYSLHDMNRVGFEKYHGNRGYMCPHWKPSEWVKSHPIKE